MRWAVVGRIKRRRGQSSGDWKINCTVLQRIRGAPREVWVGCGVVGRRRPINHSAFSAAEPHFWGRSRSPPRLSSPLGGMVDRSGHGSAGVEGVGGKEYG